MKPQVSPTAPTTVAFVEYTVRGHATYRVAWLYDGIRRGPAVGPAFVSDPRGAVRYAESLLEQQKESVA
jgi:hypothetical protein